VFTIELFADNGSGLPATAAFASYAVGNAVNRTDSGATIFGANIYNYSATIASTALTAGQTYWLSVVNNTSIDTNDDWYWLTNSTGNAAQRHNIGVAFSLSPPASFDFSLSNNAASVPEPATFGLLGLGMASLLLNRRKARG
jgi:hypothetical protein